MKNYRRKSKTGVVTPTKTTAVVLNSGVETTIQTADLVGGCRDTNKYYSSKSEGRISIADRADSSRIECGSRDNNTQNSGERIFVVMF